MPLTANALPVYKEVSTLQATTAQKFASAPDAVLGLSGGSLVIYSFDTDDTKIVEISLDGVTVHGKILPGSIQGVKFDHQYNGKVWLRGTTTNGIGITAEPRSCYPGDR